MKMTVDFGMFVDQFSSYGRVDEFSYAGQRALFDHLEEVDEDFELDVIAICCEYTEHTTEELSTEYGYLVIEEDDLIEELRDNTLVLDVGPDLYIVQSF